VPPYTLRAKTDAEGQYRIPGVIPGDYLMFAVPPSPDHAYFALDFADRHLDIAEHVSMDLGATQIVNLKLSTPK
jgi:protocatechuate 3,4-dioxygenase beta subunit